MNDIAALPNDYGALGKQMATLANDYGALGKQISARPNDDVMLPTQIVALANDGVMLPNDVAAIEQRANILRLAYYVSALRLRNTQYAIRSPSASLFFERPLVRSG